METDNKKVSETGSDLKDVAEVAGKPCSNKPMRNWQTRSADFDLVFPAGMLAQSK